MFENVKVHAIVKNLFFASETVEVNPDSVLLPDELIYEVNQQIVAQVGKGVVNGVIHEIDYSDPDATWFYVEYTCVGWHGDTVTDRTWLAYGSIAPRDEFQAAVQS